VYWRRRAVVLGAILLAVIVFFVSCSGGDDKNTKRGTGASAPKSAPASTGANPKNEPSFADAGPGGGPSLPAPHDIQSDQPSLGDGTADGDNGSSGATGENDGTNANVGAPNGTLCADSEVSVTPVPASATIKRGTPVVLRIKIKNISTRTCSRDVGADPMELYIDQGARKYWSSDTCSSAHNTDVRAFPAGTEREYSVTWNGRQSSKCSGAVAAGPAPIAGQYELRGRLATKVSDPVIITIVA
jgi:hypothetical protein